MIDPRALTERLRQLAGALAAPGADPPAVARQLAAEIDHAARPARPSGATPALSGDERQWRRP